MIITGPAGERTCRSQAWRRVLARYRLPGRTRRDPGRGRRTARLGDGSSCATRPDRGQRHHHRHDHLPSQVQTAVFPARPPRSDPVRHPRRRRTRPIRLLRPQPASRGSSHRARRGDRTARQRRYAAACDCPRDLNGVPDAATSQILQGPPGSEIGTSGFTQSDLGDGQRLWNLAPRIPGPRGSAESIGAAAN
jgi:hypothetical protein